MLIKILIFSALLFTIFLGYMRLSCIGVYEEQNTKIPVNTFTKKENEKDIYKKCVYIGFFKKNNK